MRFSARLFSLVAGVFLLASGALSCVVEVLGHLRLETPSGVVYQAYDRGPVEGATVEIWETRAGTYEEYDKTGSAASTRRVAVETTDKDGKFKFERLEPGRYEIVFISKRYGTRKAYLEVYRPKKLGKKQPQEVVAVLSRGDGPCGGVSQRDRK